MDQNIPAPPDKVENKSYKQLNFSNFKLGNTKSSYMQEKE
jgi:hypothetical protein